MRRRLEGLDLGDRLLCAKTDDDGCAIVPKERGGKPGQEIERQLIGPMDVIQDQRQGMSTGQDSQRASQCAKEAQTRGLAVQGPWLPQQLSAGEAEQRWFVGGQYLDVVPHELMCQVGVSGQVKVRDALQNLRQRLQRSDRLRVVLG